MKKLSHLEVVWCPEWSSDPHIHKGCAPTIGVIYGKITKGQPWWLHGPLATSTIRVPPISWGPIVSTRAPTNGVSEATEWAEENCWLAEETERDADSPTQGGYIGTIDRWRGLGQPCKKKKKPFKSVEWVDMPRNASCFPTQDPILQYDSSWWGHD